MSVWMILKRAIKRPFFYLWERMVFSTMGSLYLKRMLEKHYDRMFESGFGERARSLSSAQKYALEAVVYLFVSLLGQRLETGSRLFRMIGEVIKDFGPEMMKRVINGDQDAVETVNNIRKEVWTAVVAEDTPSDMATGVGAICLLDDVKFMDALRRMWAAASKTRADFRTIDINPN